MKKCVCLQSQVEFNFKGNGPASAPAAAPSDVEKKTTDAAVAAPTEAEGTAALSAMAADSTKNVTASTADSAASVAPATTSGTNDSDLWQPVIKELKAFNTAQNTDNASLCTSSLWVLSVVWLLF